MEIKDDRIDSGKAFDWGKTSREYAKYRDIYSGKFYQKIAYRGLCIKGQRVLVVGTFGAGKTRSIVAPNLIQASGSYMWYQIPRVICTINTRSTLNEMIMS